MAGLKRKTNPSNASASHEFSSKKQKTDKISKSSSKSTSKRLPATADINDSDTSEDEQFSEEIEALEASGDERSAEEVDGKSNKSSKPKESNGDVLKSSTTSAESHAAQRVLAKERKAAKPNADIIARSKKIWERLRRKSHVPLEERKELVAELYTIINGRVRDFVFKHDSVRVIQCALKYANKEQRLNITKELQADIQALVQSKYGKFMIAKIVVEGDEEIRNLVIPEFYGNVKKFINHPEAAWILDDIYRQVATKQHKAKLLREWYGTEFALDNKSRKTPDDCSADLFTILETSPEKRKPIMDSLSSLINQLIQKKMTAFTMLHDAMLQYLRNLKPGSAEFSEFLESLRNDLDDATSVATSGAASTGQASAPSTGGDLLKNLAFTSSGSQIVSLAFAHSQAKERKILLRVYKDIISEMAFDKNASRVLIAALDVIDDTRLTSKSILSELLAESTNDQTERDEKIFSILTDKTARVPLLYFYTNISQKWLFTDPDLKPLILEIEEIRKGTSKKDHEIRRKEIITATTDGLLGMISRKAPELVKTTEGCAGIVEILLSAQSSGSSSRDDAITAIANTCVGPVNEEEGHVSFIPAAGKMLRTLAQGGKYDAEVGKVVISEKTNKGGLEFVNVLYDSIKTHIVDWATGPSSYVIVAMVESKDLDEKKKEGLVKVLKQNKSKLESVVGTEGKEKGKKNGKKENNTNNAGAKMLLTLL